MDQEILHEANRAKLSELLPELHDRAFSAYDQCVREKKQMRVLETFRSPSRQSQLYDQGRRTPGPIVTWTLKSKHIERKALDFLPIGCTFDAIADVWKVFGFIRPPDLVKLGDIGHLEACDLWRAPVYPEPVKNDPRAIAARIRRLKEEAEKEKDKTRLASILRQIKRLCSIL